mgnify:CR=1 FL=1
MRMPQKESENRQTRTGCQKRGTGARGTDSPPGARDQATPDGEAGSTMMHLRFNSGTGMVALDGELNGHPR